MKKNKERLVRDMQIEKKVSQIIYDKVFIGIENGQVKLHFVDDAAEQIRKYFEGIYETDITAIW